MRNILKTKKDKAQFKKWINALRSGVDSIGHYTYSYHGYFVKFSDHDGTKGFIFHTNCNLVGDIENICGS